MLRLISSISLMFGALVLLASDSRSLGGCGCPDQNNDGICDTLCQSEGDPIPIESCDGIDNDCDGLVDEDEDGDGYDACSDCSNADASSYPGAMEWCDGIDHNCDGYVMAESDPLCFANCTELENAFYRETETIRSCTDNSQCGQVLYGTSCGCTRNWVARLDADATYFYQLMDLGNANGCNVGGISTCDCPEADGFICEDNSCGWNYL